jgi:hypothetical protein
MAKHTSGPWTRLVGERFKHDSSAGVKGPDGLYIAAALDLNRYDKDDEVEANARLIAAAPDLLAACEAALPEIYHPYDPQAGKAVYDRLRAVIDKARGE